MRISVIVPTFNEEKTINRCLEALERQTFEDYEIVVVDGHSRDNTVKIAEKYADKMLFDEGKGTAAARNLAVRSVDSEIVAFIDGDTVVPKTWTETVNNAFSESNIVGVGGPLLPDGGGLSDRLIFYVCADLLRRISSAVGFHQFSGANCAYLRKAYLKVGGFREDLDMLDDVDLSMRMKQIGKEKFEPKMYAVTSIRRTRQKGHVKTVMRYLSGYLELFKTGSVKEPGYLREIKKD